MNQLPLLFFCDTETTGLDPKLHEIVSIAWKLVDPQPTEHIVLDDDHRLVMPIHLEAAEPEALRINGFNRDHWLKNNAIGQPQLPRLLRQLVLLHAEDRQVVLAGHGVGFDEAFLEATFERHGAKPFWHYQVFDTRSLVFPMVLAGALPSAHLRDVGPALFDVQQGDVHSAVLDTELSYETYRWFMRRADWSMIPSNK